MNEEFNTFDKVQSIFTSKVPNEKWQSFLFMYKNIAAETGYIGGMSRRYEGIIIGLGSSGGIAFLKLMKTKVFSKMDIKNMIIIKDDNLNFGYWPKEYIDKVEIKHPPLNKKVLIVHIRFTTNEYHDLTVRLNNIDLPYQEDGINEFLNRYGKER